MLSFNAYYSRLIGDTISLKCFGLALRSMPKSFSSFAIISIFLSAINYSPGILLFLFKFFFLIFGSFFFIRPNLKYEFSNSICIRLSTWLYISYLMLGNTCSIIILSSILFLKTLVLSFQLLK